jgi:hypothetical protein
MCGTARTVPCVPALLLCFYKLRSKDAAIMAKYNAGELTREEADAMMSRKY